MRLKRTKIAIGLAIALGVGFEVYAHADECKETTRVTFSTPVQIPGQVLPAGTYIFQDVDKVEFPGFVQIFNADRTLTYATVRTIPVARMEVTGNPAVTVAETDAENPPVLVKWFYTGSLTGHELVYPKHQEQLLLHASQEDFVGGKLVRTTESAGE